MRAEQITRAQLGHRVNINTPTGRVVGVVSGFTVTVRTEPSGLRRPRVGCWCEIFLAGLGAITVPGDTEVQEL